MRSGTVTIYHADKSWGFIRDDNPAEQDIFVHRGEVVRSGYLSLTRGQRVQYDVAPNPRRLGKFMAVNLRLLEPIMCPPRPAVESYRDDAEAQAALLRLEMLRQS
jgi:cold shock CspA family protein